MRYPDFDLFNIKAEDMTFSHSPLLDALRKRELATNPRLLDLLCDEETNFTMPFVEDLMWRAEHKSNILINLRGARGCGKSTLAQGIKGLNDHIRENKPSIDEIVFSRKEYMGCYKGATAGELFVIDEDFGFQTQTGSYRIHESMMLAEQTFRIEEVSTIACSVAHSSPHLYDYDLLVFDYNEDEGFNRAIIFSPAIDGGVFARPTGYILFPSKQYIDKSIEKKYYAKKKEFSTAVKKGKARTIQEEYDEMAEFLIKKFKWDKLAKKPSNDVYNVIMRREYPHLANTEMSDMIQTLKFKMWEIYGTAKKEKEE